MYAMSELVDARSANFDLVPLNIDMDEIPARF